MQKKRLTKGTDSTTITRVICPGLSPSQRISHILAKTVLKFTLDRLAGEVKITRKEMVALTQTWVDMVR